MCTLAVFTRALAELPLVIAANRDEFYERPSTPPMAVARDGEGIPVLAGCDLVAGGSWLSVNARGLVVGVLNRRTEGVIDPSRRSRGLLCLDLAGERGAARAAEILARTPGELYNPFNILVADRERAFIGQNRGAGTRVDELAAGAHVLTNLDVNDATCPRVSRSARRCETIAERFAQTRNDAALIDELRAMLADHLSEGGEPEPLSRLCIHTALYGTRSSSLVLAADDERPRLFFAQGPPCRMAHRRWPTPWGTVSPLA